MVSPARRGGRLRHLQDTGDRSMSRRAWRTQRRNRQRPVCAGVVRRGSEVVQGLEAPSYPGVMPGDIPGAELTLGGVAGL
jgi:hypothetical protein